MSTQGIDLARITLCDALDLAILIEEEAMDRYAELAHQLEKHRTPVAARFFRHMEKNESKHRAKLAAKRTHLFASTPTKVTRAMLFDVEAPEYDEVRAFMPLRQALEAAMRAETKARAFFEDALTHVTDVPVRALFTLLRDEEIDHQKLVQTELDRLEPEPPASQEDYADAPAGE